MLPPFLVRPIVVELFSICYFFPFIVHSNPNPSPNNLVMRFNPIKIQTFHDTTKPHQTSNHRHPFPFLKTPSLFPPISWSYRNPKPNMGDLTVQESGQHIFRSKYSTPIHVHENTTLPEFVLRDTLEYSDKVALVEASTGKAYTYGEVVRDTARFARALGSLGLRKGHVVVVALPNLAVYPVVALGIMAAGGVFSGVNPSALASEIRKQVEDSEAKIVVADEATYDKVKDFGVPVIVIGETPTPDAVNWKELLEAADRAGHSNAVENNLTRDDLCALPYSSGTTGTSKGVMLTHRNIISNLCSSLFSFGADMIGQVTTLGLMPFFHIYGITGICCAALKTKGKVVVMGRFDLRAYLEILIEHEVTFAPIVPAIILAMVKSPLVDEFDLRRLKLQSVLTAAAPLAPELRAAFEEKYPGVVVQEVVNY